MSYLDSADLTDRESMSEELVKLLNTKTKSTDWNGQAVEVPVVSNDARAIVLATLLVGS